MDLDAIRARAAQPIGPYSWQHAQNDLPALIAEVERLTGQDKALRELLWLRHGCMALYGDDGEMQCGKCMIDFKRDEPKKIGNRFEQIGRAALRATEGTR